MNSRWCLAGAARWLLVLLVLSSLGACGSDEPAQLVVRNIGSQPLQSIQVSLGPFRETIPDLAAGDQVVITLPEERPLEVDLRWRSSVGVGYTSQNITPLLATGDDVLVELAAGRNPLFRRADPVAD
ncbi:MAG: hypothetical protein SX243_14405 [Acidobacteriota bacterium]|nr:hypothetical protein [Acidobacteriota bacterium]